MRGFIIISAVLNLSLCYAYPGSQGVGAYAYQDSAGNRYGGTYDLGPDAIPAESNFISPFNDFQDVDNFFPAYFKNFQKFIEHFNNLNTITPRLARRSRPYRRTFGSNIANQRFPHAKTAYDLTPQRVPHFSPFFRFPSYEGFPNTVEPIQPLQPRFGMPSFGPNFASNSAFAGAVAGPGGIHQVAAIDPPSSNTQNIDISRASQPQGKSNFYGVSSSSYASSANVNGKVTGTRRAETVVNENGKITKYQVGE